MKSLCVYCGSRPGNDPAFKEAAIALGQEAAKRSCRIVYGGGKLGLMGATAGAARDAGGKVFGVIPDFLVELEGILEGVDHKVVSNMHERKMTMYEESDAIVTLPGGIGTLEELIEVLSWARLGLHRKPLIVLNVNGFWTPLRELLNHVVESNLADKELLNDLVFVDNVQDVFKEAEDRMLSARV
ncbi:TIGR00730 family Rossman fold protein [Hyphococcus sp. DH-69]|uniref:LOG family protein n=1 Tax=Hyphococcus formosus TaxID=3143534 RepID=UPI00398B6755